MLLNLKIGTRLAVGFGGLIATTAAAFTAAVLFGLQWQADTADSERLARARTELVVGMRLDQLTAVSRIQSAGLRSDSAEANRDIEAYRAAMKAVIAGEAEFARTEIDVDERETLDRVAALREQAAAIATEAVNFAATFASEEVAKTLSDRYFPVQEKWGAELNRLARLQAERATADTRAIVTTSRRTSLLLTGVLCVATLAAIAFAVAMTRSVTRPLKVAGDLAARVAGGDLSVVIEVVGKDEVALLLGSLQTMTRQLAAMVQLVRESAASIGSASEEVSSGSQDLSVRTKRQATSLKETSATIATLGSAAARNTENAEAVRQLADQTAGLAVQGGVSMAQVVLTMSGISASSRRIVEIIAVIDRIAFLTNILALNAAVEAARAGEHGRGFAVVASEVRALAQRVAEASKEVRGLIGESTERVDSGARLVGDLGTTMQELVVGVDRLRGLVGDISLASTLQGEGVIQVTGSITVIDDGTQANAVMVEQMAASASSMNAETRRLSAILARFTLSNEIAPKPA